MQDESNVYLLLGIENQSEQNFAMPVKNMVYDSLEHAGQVEKSDKSHRMAKEATTAYVGKSRFSVTRTQSSSSYQLHNRIKPTISRNRMEC